MFSFKGKKIVIGVTGSIAVYKTCSLVRGLKKLGAEVFVVMTKSAREFVSPLTFQTLSNNKVLVDLFDDNNELNHLSLAKDCDLLLIAPATANIIGKCANAICDDAVSTLFVSVKCPILMVPAMHEEMWLNAIVQDNVAKLKGFGVNFLGPLRGDLSCGDFGEGRMLDENLILESIEYSLSEKDLSGKRVLITVGSTYESIDAVRYISNWSSGKMGRALVRELYMRGAKVQVVSSKKERFFVNGIDYFYAKSAVDMMELVDELIDKADVYISTAAIADFKPARTFSGKLDKKVLQTLDLELNEDILVKVKSKKSNKKFIGFVLDAELAPDKILNKKSEKALDVCIAVTTEAFMKDRIHGRIYVDKSENIDFDVSKVELAGKIVDLLV